MEVSPELKIMLWGIDGQTKFHLIECRLIQGAGITPARFCKSTNQINIETYYTIVMAVSPRQKQIMSWEGHAQIRYHLIGCRVIKRGKITRA